MEYFRIHLCDCEKISTKSNSYACNNKYQDEGKENKENLPSDEFFLLLFYFRALCFFSVSVTVPVFDATLFYRRFFYRC